jgi:hypothetical protein
MLRYLRYVAAVGFALLALALIGLWVRSYYSWDIVHGALPGGYSLKCTSNHGMLSIERCEGSATPTGHFGWSLLTTEPMRREPLPGAPLSHRLGFSYFSFEDGWSVAVPHWFLAASSLGLAALFAFKRTWRYSLRTILVATTLLGGLLGLAVYAV